VIHVLALLTAHPGQREALLAEFRANMPNVHAEKGCIEYRPVIDAAGFDKLAAPLGPDTFAVIEKWESAEALRAHAAAPHMAAYAARARPLIASRVIHVLADA
jgi:quinol monooxygenase YgiN